MSRAPKVSRTRLAALCLSLALLAVTVLARQRGWWFAPFAPTSLDELRLEHARLSPHDDDTLARLRRELAALHANASVAPEALTASAGNRFTSSFDPETHRLTLRAEATPPRWTDIVASVVRLEQHPGWRIVSLDLRSRGTRHRREISAVEIVLAPAVAIPGRPPVGLVSPGGPAPARPRKPGRSSTLRRTSASAGRLRRPPPALSPDFALFRARPSGVGRLMSHPLPKLQLNSLYP